MNSLVTGGVQGIGKSIVQELKSRSDSVFVFDRISDDDPRVKDLKKLNIHYIKTDISSVESIKNGFFQIKNILNNSNLDLLVNNAGITNDNLAIRMSEENWDSVLDVNLKGAFFCSQQAIKIMMRHKKGYIINISSIVGQNGNPGQANYTASKAGLISVTKSLAQEYASRNILINAIAPGFIKTEMTQKLPQKIQDLILQRIALKRFGQPKEVAQLVSFLSSGNADYITGSVIDLNGGMF